MQSVVVPTCLVYSVCTLLAPPINWVLVFGLGWGLRGSAAAYNIVEILNCVGLLCVICWKHRQLDGTGAETWHGWYSSSPTTHTHTHFWNIDQVYMKLEMSIFQLAATELINIFVQKTQQADFSMQLPV